jgi:DNA-binding winged helix-turn-helix (wHTH) protein
MRVRFGDCAFDSETRECFREGKPVHLSPKAFRMLELLIEARPRALSKEELQQRLWPETFVTEGNLATLAAEIRRAIGETGRESRPVRTVYGYGYAFSGEAVEEPRPDATTWPRFELILGKHPIPLQEGESLIGRDRDVPVRIEDPTVSRHHARIVVAGDVACIEDLGSKNGTSVEGKPVRDSVRLSDGDEIKVGSVFLTFHACATEQSTETARE